MASWAAFYIKTTNIQLVVDKLKTLTGCDLQSQMDWEEADSKQYDYPRNCFYAIISNDSWVTVSPPIETELMLQLSAEFGTVIELSYQTSSGVYYFALYKEGICKREIQYIYDLQERNIDKGERFDFEDALTDKNKPDHFFMPHLEAYCLHFGLNNMRGVYHEDATCIYRLSDGKGGTSIKEDLRQWEEYEKRLPK